MCQHEGNIQDVEKAASEVAESFLFHGLIFEFRRFTESTVLDRKSSWSWGDSTSMQETCLCKHSHAF